MNEPFGTVTWQEEPPPPADDRIQASHPVKTSLYVEIHFVHRIWALCTCKRNFCPLCGITWHSSWLFCAGRTLPIWAVCSLVHWSHHLPDHLTAFYAGMGSGVGDAVSNASWCHGCWAKGQQGLVKRCLDYPFGCSFSLGSQWMNCYTYGAWTLRKVSHSVDFAVLVGSSYPQVLSVLCLPPWH